MASDESGFIIGGGWTFDGSVFIRGGGWPLMGVVL